jgi:hypothetical protein
MSDLKRKAELLEDEAALLIDRAILNLPVNTRSEAARRLVECIVGAAILRVADIQRSAQGKPADEVKP